MQDGIYVLYQSCIDGKHGSIPPIHNLGLRENQVESAIDTIRGRGDVYVDTATWEQTFEWVEGKPPVKEKL